MFCSKSVRIKIRTELGQSWKLFVFGPFTRSVYFINFQIFHHLLGMNFYQKFDLKNTVTFLYHQLLSKGVFAAFRYWEGPTIVDFFGNPTNPQKGIK